MATLCLVSKSSGTLTIYGDFSSYGSLIDNNLEGLTLILIFDSLWLSL